jgi:hypothetical protein
MESKLLLSLPLKLLLSSFLLETVVAWCIAGSTPRFFL